MSVVIVGEMNVWSANIRRPVKKHGCSAKVYVKGKGGFSKRMGVRI